MTLEFFIFKLLSSPFISNKPSRFTSTFLKKQCNIKPSLRKVSSLIESNTAFSSLSSLTFHMVSYTRSLKSKTFLRRIMTPSKIHILDSLFWYKKSFVFFYIWLIPSEQFCKQIHTIFFF